MSRRACGFTLIELLVVIAIIAILAAILFPVFTAAREKAKQGTCQSNLKQWAAAMSMYVGDNSARYPAYRFWELPDYWWWTDALMPYMSKTLMIRWCPSRPNLLNREETAGVNSWKLSRYQHYGYGYWWTKSQGEQGMGRWPGPAESIIKRPSRTILIAESTNAIAVVDYHECKDPDIAWGMQAAAARNADTVAWLKGRHGVDIDRHSGRFNAAFCDGHVGALPPQVESDSRYWIPEKPK